MVLALLVLKTSALARLRHDLIMALANSLALLGTRLRGIVKRVRYCDHVQNEWRTM